MKNARSFLNGIHKIIYRINLKSLEFQHINGNLKIQIRVEFGRVEVHRQQITNKEGKIKMEITLPFPFADANTQCQHQHIFCL